MKLVALLLATLGLFAQDPQPSARIEVNTSNTPVQGATVQLNGQTVQTGPDGVAAATVPLGPLKIAVTKEGFLLANTSIDINGVKQWTVQVELQPAEQVTEEITVHATRTDARIQDSPLRVEVLQQEEIEILRAELEQLKKGNQIGRGRARLFFQIDTEVDHYLKILAGSTVEEQRHR